MSVVPTTVLVAELLSRKINLFASIAATKPSGVITVSHLLDGVKLGRWQRQIAEVRDAMQNAGKAACDEAKRRLLPAVTPSGLFDHRHADGLQCHSGLLCLDFDDLDHSRITALRQVLVADAHMLAVFTSPSGRGLKALVPVHATDQDTHLTAFLAYEAYFQARRWALDRACKDVVRACYVSHDPELWVREPGGEPVRVLSAPAPAPAAAPTPTTCTLHSTIHSSPPTEKASGAQIAATIRKLEDLRKQKPELVELYETHVAPHVTPVAGKRNESLTAVVPYLHRAVSKTVGEQLVETFLQVNRDIFAGTLDETDRSFQSLWEGCEQNYPAELSVNETPVYSTLHDERKTIFRILRDLALRVAPDPFFMSCDQLRLRLGPTCNGYRELRWFRDNQIIVLVTPGQRREQGVAGKAAYYGWNL
jgi:hypothetical protein